METRKVIIRRKEVLNHLPKEIRAGAIIKLGSMFKGRRPLRGVTGDEELRLLAKILPVSPDNKAVWDQKVQEFWASMSIKVPYAGVELDVSKNDAGEPINIEDYLKYQWAIKHRHMAMSEHEMNESGDKRFYIYDPHREKTAKSGKIQLRKEADKEFIKVTSDEELMRRVYRAAALGNPDVMDKTDVENALFDYKDESPNKFLKVAQDKDLDVKADIEELIEYSIIVKAGNAFVFDGDVVANSLSEMLAYMKSKKNSGTVNIMQAKLKEAK